MLATWDTRFSGLRPWYPGVSPGNFEIIWLRVTKFMVGSDFSAYQLGLAGMVVQALISSLAFLMETS